MSVLSKTRNARAIKRFNLLIACLAGLCLAYWTISGVQAADKKSGTIGQASAAVKPITLTGHVNVLAGACAAAGITIEATTLPTMITKVRIGSPAYYAGVAENDKVLQGQLDQNTMMLRIERGGKQYTVSLRYTPDNLMVRKPKADKVEKLPVQPKQVRLAAEATKAADWQKLKEYDITILLDSSGSMGSRLSAVNESKWEWCQDEIYNLAQEAEKLGSGTFDLCPFASSYQLTTDCNAEKCMRVLQGVRFGGGTNLAGPLNDVLENRMGKPHSKPLLIIVITDGLVSDEKIEDVLIDTARRMKSAREARVLFLQVGDDSHGQRLAEILDNDLTSMGAPYDIVNSITSDELLNLGLRRGLIRALSKPQESHGTAGNDSSAELARVREELARIRRENAETKAK